MGVVSDGVLNLAAAQAAGELPPDVTIVDPTTYGPGTGDEGTAITPGAQNVIGPIPAQPPSLPPQDGEVRK